MLGHSVHAPGLLLALAALLAIGTGAGTASAGPTGKIYWIGSGRIGRASLDGSGAKVVLSGISQPEGIVVDLAAGKAYWTAQGNSFGDGTIQRADLDGSNVETLISGLGGPSSIALDTRASKMYWREAALIRRADLDGSDVEDLMSTESGSEGVAVDPLAGKLYWPGDVTVGAVVRQAIWRANLDGTSGEPIVTEGLDVVEDIALDLVGGKVYWVDAGLSRIQRANLDGTDVEDVLVVHSPRMLAVDPAGGKVYWSTGVAISRANLDGSNPEELLIPPAVVEHSDIALAVGAQLGDANCDSNVNSVDAALDLQFDARLLDSLPCQAAADVNDDGRVDAIDAAFVLQLDAGLIDHFGP